MTAPEPASPAPARRVLITAGPTREHWDAVRFLSSAATGRLGIEIAKAAAEAGLEAVLVLGPTHLADPASPRISVHRVVSARDMLAACEAEWPRCHALVATAAVADFRPAEREDGKRTKATAGDAIPLAPNPDILATLAASKGDRHVIGFALQADDDIGASLAKARGKLVRKNADAIVLDSPAAMGAATADFRVLTADGTVREYLATSKPDLAHELVRLLQQR